MVFVYVYLDFREPLQSNEVTGRLRRGEISCLTECQRQFQLVLRGRTSTLSPTAGPAPRVVQSQPSKYAAVETGKDQLPLIPFKLPASICHRSA